MDKSLSVYICYAAQDDASFGENGKKWVHTLQRVLLTILEDILKPYTIEIFLVEREALAYTQFKASDVVIFVLSDAFNDFLCDIGEASPVKILKNAVPFAQQPIFLQTLLAFNFYTHNTPAKGSAANKYLEGEGGYQLFFEKPLTSANWLIITDLCYYVAGLLQKKQTTHHHKGFVYLAQTGADIDKERQMVYRELQRHGYQVLPQQQLPPKRGELEATVVDNLKKCVLSIHMLGGNYGEVVSDTNLSVVELENNIAAEFVKKNEQTHGQPPLYRLIWLSDDQRLFDERQRYYVDRLTRSAEEQYGAEVLQNQIEEFKTMIVNILDNTNTSQEDAINEGTNQTNTTSIYLVVDKRDMTYVQPLQDWLTGQGCQVLLPIGENVFSNPRLLHQYYLNTCTAAIIFIKEAKDEWLESKLQDILKTPGMGRNASLKIAIFADNMTDSERAENIKLRTYRHIHTPVYSSQSAHDFSQLLTFLKEIQVETIVKNM